MRAVVAPIGLTLALGVSSVHAQALPESLIAQIRAGAARAALPSGSVAVPLLGPPHLPLIEVRLNGMGPFRFLVDLGSNVVIVRRDVADSARGTVLVDRARSDIVEFDSLDIGGARYEKVVAGAYDTLDVAGLVGYNLLQHTSFTVDFPHRRLVLHARTLPLADNRTVFSYVVRDRLPFVTAAVGPESLSVNLETGASEWMTIPPALQGKLRWRGPLEEGPVVSNNQTGRTRVKRGTLRDPLRLGRFRLDGVRVYVNPDADSPWLGCAAMEGAAWTFDPRNLRLAVTGQR